MKKKDKTEIENEKPKKMKLHVILWIIAVSLLVFMVAGNLVLCFAAKKKVSEQCSCFQ